MSYYCYFPKKKLSIWKKLAIYFCIIFLILFLFLIFIANPIIYDACNTNVNALAYAEINNAVFETFDKSVAYNDIVHFERNKNDEIVFVSVNTVLVNQLGLDITNSTQDKIQELCKKGINIPLGDFFGILFLSGRGPNVNIKFTPYGYTDAKFFSVFLESGINQTLHQIKMHIVSEMTIYLPLQIRKTYVTVEVIVCENFIVGKVPDYLINFPLN